ncbi:TIR domain-containing protein [Sorangium sp. So ce260]|uniref:TIR domain-containing protein n=1 Tax=Sorangium sp. So ce260 TaxID=3133291 RepID=UPI003F5FCF70
MTSIGAMSFARAAQGVPSRLMATTLFSWIHLSDIHFGHGSAGDRWDQRRVLHLVRTDIAAMVGRGTVKPDAILVTGDVAFSGNARKPAPDQEPREYADATVWLKGIAGDVGIAPQDIFVVPGNHDVNRKVDDDDDVARLIRDLREGVALLDSELAKPKMRARLASRMSAYLEFAAQFAPACRLPPAAPEERLFWTYRMEQSGLRLRLVGLNTALLAADERTFGEDRGRLRVGVEQVTRAVLDPPVARDELVIALSHHPLRAGWVADERDVDTWIRSQMHIHLSGHVHQADTEMSRAGSGGEFVRVTAGAAHGEQEPNVPAAHGYSFASVMRDDAGKLWLRVWPRRWSPTKAAFQPDADNLSGLDEGRIYEDHALRLRLAPVAPDGAPEPTPPAAQPARPDTSSARAAADVTVEPSPARSPATGPLQVFISYAPEDAKHLAELEKHLKMLGPRRMGLIDSWSARSVGVGGEEKLERDRRLKSAHVILLLVSPDFLNSDECYDVEVQAAMAAHERKEACIVPVLLREVSYEGTPFAKLRPTPDNRKPVTEWTSMDAAFTEVAKDIRRAVESLRKPA